MKFKNWLIKESPDSVSVNKSLVKWFSGITFYMFDNYVLFTQEGSARTHDAILEKLRSLYKKAILPAYKKEILLNQLDEIIKSEANLLSYGNINQNALEQIIEMLKVYSKSGDYNPNYPEDYHRNSFNEIVDWPEIILGRIWPNVKVISFWNRPEYIFKESTQILNFVSKFGNPKEYYYDMKINSQFVKINYENFIKRDARGALLAAVNNEI